MNRLGQYLVTLAVVGVYVSHYAGIGPVWAEGDMRLQDACLMLVIGYWLGSSDGSAKKQKLLEDHHDTEKRDA